MIIPVVEGSGISMFLEAMEEENKSRKLEPEKRTTALIELILQANYCWVGEMWYDILLFYKLPKKRQFYFIILQNWLN